MKKYFALLCAYILIFSAGCSEDGGVSGDHQLAVSPVSFDYLPSGGWTGYYEVPSDVSIQNLWITENSNGTIDFTLHCEFPGIVSGGEFAVGDLSGTAMISVSEDGEEALFIDPDTKWTLRFSLSPKRIFISQMDNLISNPYCAPGATFDGTYNRISN